MNKLKIAAIFGATFAAGYFTGRVREAMYESEDLKTAMKHNEKLTLGCNAYYTTLNRILNGEDPAIAIADLEQEQAFIELIMEQDMNSEEGP